MARSRRARRRRGAATRGDARARAPPQTNREHRSRDDRHLARHLVAARRASRRSLASAAASDHRPQSISAIAHAVSRATSPGRARARAGRCDRRRRRRSWRRGRRAASTALARRRRSRAATPVAWLATASGGDRERGDHAATPRCSNVVCDSARRSAAWPASTSAYASANGEHAVRSERARRGRAFGDHDQRDVGPQPRQPARGLAARGVRPRRSSWPVAAIARVRQVERAPRPSTARPSATWSPVHATTACAMRRAARPASVAAISTPASSLSASRGPT